MGRPRVATFVGALLAVTVALATRAPVSGQSRLVVTRPGDERITQLLDRYARGEASVPELSAESVNAHLTDLRRVAPRWVGAKAAPDAARRRLVVGTYVLDLIDQNFVIAWQFGNGLLEWACALVRDGPPQPIEKSWHMAAIALVERSVGVGRATPGRQDAARVRLNQVLPPHIVHARLRFPGDGAWVLASAISEEFVTWPLPRDEGTLTLSFDDETRIRNAFRAAFDDPDARAEAHLRYGFLELRRRRYDDALAEFDRAGTPDDRVLRYWLHLFRGRTLERTKRPGDAVESYRAAVMEFPNAQAATVALGAALASQGQAVEAGNLLTRMLTVEPPLDPWRVYGFPAYRYWSALLSDLRQAIRP